MVSSQSTRVGFCAILAALHCMTALASVPELVIYTYDSMLGREGLGRILFPRFEKQQRCKIRALTWGSGAQIAARLEMDARRNKAGADLILGIDQATWELVKPYTQPWKQWRPLGYPQILPQVIIEPGFVPFDFSYLALITDVTALPGGFVPEISIQDLLNPTWRRKMIFEDPRTSTPGLSFLLFTQQVLGANLHPFWKSLRHQWLTLTPGWDSAYPLLLSHQAPLVWSYLTSEAYHAETAPTSPQTYRAILFKEGQPMQIEGAAWIKGDEADHELKAELSKKFLEFLLSPSVQALIPKTQWMLPVMPEVPLPKSFSALPIPKKIISLKMNSTFVKKTVYDWNLDVSGP